MILLLMIALMYSLHEYGHYHYAKQKGCNPKFFIHKYGLYMGINGNYSKLTFSEKIWLYLSGIVIGAVPIFTYNYFVLNSSEFLGAMLVVYALVSAADIIYILLSTACIFKYGNCKLQKAKIGVITVEW